MQFRKFKARDNKTGSYYFLFYFYFDIRGYMVFQYDWELVLIKRILIGYEAMLNRAFPKLGVVVKEMKKLSTNYLNTKWMVHYIRIVLYKIVK